MGAETTMPHEAERGFEHDIAAGAYTLWSEVLRRAVNDFKVSVAHRSDPDAYPASRKALRSILCDGCDPEYWFFSDRTGFDAVCMVLDVEADVIRTRLREWMREELGVEPAQ